MPGAGAEGTAARGAGLADGAGVPSAESATSVLGAEARGTGDSAAARGVRGGDGRDPEGVDPSWPAAGTAAAEPPVVAESWAAAGSSAESDGSEPWPGADVTEEDDRSVGLPATVLAPALSGADDEDTPRPGVRPDAKTELMPQGSALPRTTIAPAIDAPDAAATPTGPGAPGAPGGSAAYAATMLAHPDAAGGPGIPGAPGAGAPGAPAAPSAPGAPGTPGGGVHHAATMLAAPGTPGMPGAPGGPAVPPAPGAPGAPRNSGGPAVPPAPGAPGTPGNPGGPAAPSAPGAPGAPGGGVHHAATMLASPGTPGMPAAPGAPGAPRNSGGPAVPPAPGAPGVPGAVPGHGAPGAPGAAPTPGAPGAPGAPGPAPGAPGVPGVPGTPGPAPAHGAPGAPAVPGTPAAPSYGYPPAPAGVPTVGPGYMAVLRYRAPDGSEQQIIRRSAPGTPHPEWQILHELRAMGVPPQQVLELHTELESCDLPGGYCARMVRESWPQVRVSHTAAYGRDLPSRQQGMRHLLEHQGELHQVADGPARPAPNRVPLPHPAHVRPAPAVGPDVIGRELVESFGPQGVFRCDQRAVSRQGVPEIVAHTLVWAGLPVDLGPFFWAQAQPGRPVPTLAELAAERGVRPAADAGSYLVMGSDYGRQLCVQYGTAHIVAVPLEAGPDGAPAVPQFVNTSLPQFVRSLALLGKMWRWRYGLTPEQAGRWTVDFQDQLAALDPAALASPENWWAVLVEQMWDGLF
nr:SUKH-4 family immunity protein [Streptomyces mashuensis]